jgi:diguanylate cyclase (GGDEF)-like protein
VYSVNCSDSLTAGHYGPDYVLYNRKVLSRESATVWKTQTAPESIIIKVCPVPHGAPMTTEAVQHDRLIMLAVGGERTIARMRLVVILFIFMIPLFQALRRHPILDAEILIGFGATSLALAIALTILVVAPRIGNRTWFSYLTSLIDVTLVTAALIAFLVLSAPHSAVNSKVVWEIYLLAIGATALRPRHGIVIITTLAAIAEYLSIVLYASLHWNLNDPALFSPFPYGMFDWGTQIGRMALMASAGLLAIVLARRTIYLARLAGRDVLTGASSRTFFQLRLHEEIQRAQRYRRPLVLALLDVDNLKQINDRLGHELGDVALVRVVGALRNGLRASDGVFRYGGDEIAVLMPESTQAEAEKRLKRIAARIRSQPLEDLPLTVSVGVANCPHDANVGDSLLRVADRRLYAAKRGGRNRIVGTEEPDWTPAGIGR